MRISAVGFVVASAFLFGCHGSSPSGTSTSGNVATNVPNKATTSLPPSEPTQQGAPTTPSNPTPTPSAPPANPSGPGTGAPIKIPHLNLGTTKHDHIDAVPDQPGEGGWHNTSMTPLALAAKIDHAFATIAGVEGDTSTIMKLPIGTGQGVTTSKWLAPNVYKVEYLGQEGDHVSRQTVIADGKHVMREKFTAPKGQSAFGTPYDLVQGGTASGATLLQQWPMRAPEVVFGRFLNGDNVWVPFVKALMSPNSGFDVEVERRDVNFNGQIVTDYRLFAVRKAALAKTQGPAQFEVVVDGNRYYPVTIRTRYGKVTAAPIEIDWATKWMPGTFSASEFKVPNLKP